MSPQRAAEGREQVDPAPNGGGETQENLARGHGGAVFGYNNSMGCFLALDTMVISAWSFRGIDFMVLNGCDGFCLPVVPEIRRPGLQPPRSQARKTQAKSVTIDKTRRFTDREVALVLRKASEMEEAEGTGEGAGLSLGDLEQIAAEVGISRDVLARAVATLDARAGGNPFARGQLVHQVIRAVEGELSDEGGRAGRRDHWPV